MTKEVSNKKDLFIILAAPTVIGLIAWFLTAASCAWSGSKDECLVYNVVYIVLLILSWVAGTYSLKGSVNKTFFIRIVYVVAIFAMIMIPFFI